LIPAAEMHEWAMREGLWIQKLYQLGFPHANCGGFCIKAGQAHFKHLLEVMPERFAYHERKEQELRDYLQKDVAVLKHRSGPDKNKPMTLRVLREKVEKGQQCDAGDWGGCGCFSGTDSPAGE
jgi:hypothetical protein